MLGPHFQLVFNRFAKFQLFGKIRRRKDIQHPSSLHSPLAKAQSLESPKAGLKYSNAIKPQHQITLRLCFIIRLDELVIRLDETLHELLSSPSLLLIFSKVSCCHGDMSNRDLAGLVGTDLLGDSTWARTSPHL